MSQNATCWKYCYFSIAEKLPDKKLPTWKATSKKGYESKSYMENRNILWAYKPKSNDLKSYERKVWTKKLQAEKLQAEKLRAEKLRAEKPTSRKYLSDNKSLQQIYLKITRLIKFFG
jgi:hypothetical protein